MQMIEAICVTFAIYGTFSDQPLVEAHSFLESKKTIYMKGAIVP